MIWMRLRHSKSTIMNHELPDSQLNTTELFNNKLAILSGIIKHMMNEKHYLSCLIVNKNILCISLRLDFQTKNRTTHINIL